MKIKFKKDIPIFSKRLFMALIKNILHIIILIIVIIFYFYQLNLFYSIAGIFVFFIIFTAKDQKKQLVSLEIKEEEVQITYLNYDKKVNIVEHLKKCDIVFQNLVSIRNIKVLHIYINNKLILKQAVSNGWSREELNQIDESFNNIKNKYMRKYVWK